MQYVAISVNFYFLLPTCLVIQKVSLGEESGIGGMWRVQNIGI